MKNFGEIHKWSPAKNKKVKSQMNFEVICRMDYILKPI